MRVVGLRRKPVCGANRIRAVSLVLRSAYKIRNTNIEIRNKFEARMAEIQNEIAAMGVCASYIADSISSGEAGEVNSIYT